MKDSVHVFSGTQFSLLRFFFVVSFVCIGSLSRARFSARRALCPNICFGTQAYASPHTRRGEDRFLSSSPPKKK